MLRKTVLHARHVDAGALMVPFGGWDMPLHYGSQIQEHHAVRQGAGLFDVSHMTVIDVAGQDSKRWLQRLLANDVARLQQPGRGLYSCMLNESGGVVDDLIVYHRGGERYRLVVNAATREADLAWIQSAAKDFTVSIEERTDLAMLAAQGPDACRLAAPLLGAEVGDAALKLRRFASLEQDGLFVARTGYTGEDGWEILLPETAATSLWDRMLAAGFVPCGLGARDTLRLEAGLNLYGQDMTSSTSPLVSNLGWTVAWEPAERDFIGRRALEQERARGPQEKLVGLVLEQRGIMRAQQVARCSAGPGVVTSGGFSPTLQRSVALARLPVAAEGLCEVEIRNKWVPAQLVQPPFIKNGKANIDCGELQ